MTASRLTPSRALQIVAIVAGVYHLWLASSTNLAVTNDGIDYLTTAVSAFREEPLQIAEFRTPGYPAILFVCFRLFGYGAFGVLLVQHLLGAITAVVIARIALRFAPPVPAMALGLLCAVDPAVSLFASVLLTENASICLFALSALLALEADRRPVVTSVALGGTLALLILVRPAFQVVVPFLIIGVAMHRSIRWPRRLGAAGATVGALLLCLTPWLAFNRERGLTGVAQGAAPAFWVSLVQQDLLVHDFPLPPDVERRASVLNDKHQATPEMWAFVGSPADSMEQARRMPKICKAWAIESMRRNLPAYLRRMGDSFLWQMHVFRKNGQIGESQMKWFTWLVARDLSEVGHNPINIHVDQLEPLAAPLEMSGEAGSGRALIRWWNENWPQGIPHLPLLALALAGGVICLNRGDYVTVLVLLASGALIGVHVVMLFHQSRYSMPSVVLWYGLAPIVPMSLWRLVAGSKPESNARP